MAKKQPRASDLKKGKNKKKAPAKGKMKVNSTFGNNKITITTDKGDVISWSSSGKMGFKGSKKSTPYAAQVAAEDACNIAYDMGMRSLEVVIVGAGSGRESAIRAASQVGFTIESIIDKTPIPHNGCRAKGRRRV